MDPKTRREAGPEAAVSAHPSTPQPTRFIDPAALTRISSLELSH